MRTQEKGLGLEAPVAESAESWRGKGRASPVPFEDDEEPVVYICVCMCV